MLAKITAIYNNKKMLSMIGLGFSSGFPLVLVSSTLSLWLKESGLSYAIIGLFALTKTPYSFKWMWSPLVDKIRAPIFWRLGRRRGWAFLLQIFLMLSILAMSRVDPQQSPWLMAFFAFLVVFFSASQDIVLDAYRIDVFEGKDQGAASAVFVLGYRFGLIFAGAGALWLAEILSWHSVYAIMSLGAVVGAVSILCSKEADNEPEYKPSREKLPFKGRINRFLKEFILEPFLDFAKHKKWWVLLLFVFCYRLGDEYKGAMAFPFYIDMGFTKSQIASISKLYGMIATICGGLIGGIMVNRMGLKKTLLIAGILQGVTNFVYVGQAYMGDNPYFLALTICMDNLAGGMAATALVAYMSSLCSIAYSATQYALLSSMTSLTRDIIGASSGYVAEVLAWPWFFTISGLLVLPMLFLYAYMSKHKLL